MMAHQTSDHSLKQSLMSSILRINLLKVIVIRTVNDGVLRLNFDLFKTLKDS